MLKDTMGGREAVASNEIMTLRVRGLYQQMFSGKWHIGIEVRPLRDFPISKVECKSFSGTGTLLDDHKSLFQPSAGQFKQHMERQVDVPFIHPTASMLVTFYDDQGGVLGKFEITHIVDHMIGVGILPADKREVYENG